MSSLENLGIKLSHLLGSVRTQEYAVSFSFLEKCASILDVGCGTGTFMQLAPDRIQGLDFNPENVAYCQARGLKAISGDARKLPFADETFEGTHCSHVLQVFHSDDAVTTLRELVRVTKPGGRIVVTTLNWFDRFYRHPENARAYPPDALRRLFAPAHGASSPMYDRMPRLQQERIWLRHPPLLEFEFTTHHMLDRLGGLVNRLQYRIFLRKYWAYDAYVICFRKKTA
jgi:SAM-dependent methyltransferase